MQINARKQRIYGAALSYVSIGVNVVTALLYTPLVLRKLGQSGYGVYSLATSCLSYLTLLAAGMNAAFVRFYVQSKTKAGREVPELNGMFLKIFSVLAVVSLGLGTLLATFSTQIFGSKILPQEQESLKTCLFLLVAIAFVTVFDCVFSSFVAANERFIFGRISALALSIAGMLVTVAVLLAGFGAEAVMAVSLAKSTVTLVVNMLYCIRKLHISFQLSANDRTMLRNIAVFAAAISLQGIMDQVNWQIDKFILARVSGSTAVSVYSVGGTLNSYFLTFGVTVDSVFITQMNSLVALNDTDAINRLFIKVARIQAMISYFVMSIYIFWGKNFVMRWAGSEYETSYYVGLLLMLPVTFAASLDFGMHILRAYNKQNQMIAICLILAVINLVISIPLAKAYGAVGSALGTFISELFIVGIGEIYTFHKKIKLDMKKYVSEMLHLMLAIAPALLCGTIIRMLHIVKNSYPSIIIAVILYTLIYALSLWFLGVNTDEKVLVRSAAAKARQILFGHMHHKE